MLCKGMNILFFITNFDRKFANFAGGIEALCFIFYPKYSIFMQSFVIYEEEDMAFFNKMKDSISVAGQEVAQKAKNTTESAKIGNRIKVNESMIEKLIVQVGKRCVSNHLNDKDTEYDDLFQEILRLKQENQAMEDEQWRLTAMNACPQCGFMNNQTAKFCIKCGAPLEEMTKKYKRKCENCGTANSEDALFCIECGMKLMDK